MKHFFKITGMTCKSCKASVEKYISQLKSVIDVEVYIDKEEVVIEMSDYIAIDKLQRAIPEKYTITEINSQKLTTESSTSGFEVNEDSKLKQLKPLFLIIFYILISSVLLNYKNWNWIEFMTDFMGLFYIIFSFFKMLDLKGFPNSFRMYDPLAKRIPIYAKVYPFIETVLGLMFLMRFEITIALWITIFVLGTTTIGVAKVLLNKKSLRCACLGTALKLPMSEATLIENTIMIVMATLMLVDSF